MIDKLHENEYVMHDKEHVANLLNSEKVYVKQLEFDTKEEVIAHLGDSECTGASVQYRHGTNYYLLKNNDGVVYSVYEGAFQDWLSFPDVRTDLE